MQAYVTNHAFKASWRANLMFGVPNLANLSAVRTAGLRLCGAECLHLDIGLAEDRISFSGITAAITQVAANKFKIKTDAKCDLGSSHCYPACSMP